MLSEPEKLLDTVYEEKFASPSQPVLFVVPCNSEAPAAASLRTLLISVWGEWLLTLLCVVPQSTYFYGRSEPLKVTVLQSYRDDLLR